MENVMTWIGFIIVAGIAIMILVTVGEYIKKNWWR